MVLCGSKAIDDPESQGIFNKVMLKAKNFVRNGEVILITTENHILVNSLQRSSAVIIQKSLREGFGLSVTEALWKGKPVVASNKRLRYTLPKLPSATSFIGQCTS